VDPVRPEREVEDDHFRVVHRLAVGEPGNIRPQ
jgi:hypothetical protein